MKKFKHLSSALDAIKEFFVLCDLNQFADEAWNLFDVPHQAGSIYREEGIILYSLVRFLQPKLVLELGTFEGAGTNWLLEGIKTNECGRAVTVDRRSDKRFACLLSEEDRRSEKLAVMQGDALEYFEGVHQINFVFEDLDHTTPTTERAVVLAKKKLTVGGFLVSHDAALVPKFGAQVCKAYENQGILDETLVLKVASAPTGLAIWRKSEESK